MLYQENPHARNHKRHLEIIHKLVFFKDTEGYNRVVAGEGCDVPGVPRVDDEDIEAEMEAASLQAPASKAAATAAGKKVKAHEKRKAHKEKMIATIFKKQRTQPPPIQKLATGAASPVSGLFGEVVSTTHGDAVIRGDKAVLMGLHRKVLLFQNNNNIAQRAICESNCPEFCDMLDYILKHSNTIKKFTKDEIHMGWQRFSKLRKDEYESVMTATAGYVKECRDRYAELCGQQVPVIVAQHDYCVL